MIWSVDMAYRECKGLCKDHSWLGLIGKNIRLGLKGMWHIKGNKYCTSCQYAIVTESVRCPCCVSVLKYKPKSALRNRQMREREQVVRY